MNNLKKTIEYLLYLFVFLLPLQTRWIIKAGNLNGYSEYLTLSLYGTDIVLFFLLILFIIWKIKQSQKSTYCIQYTVYSIWFFIALIDLGAFISIFFAQDKLLATFGYARLLLGIGLFWLIYKAEFSRFKLTVSFLTGACLQGLLAIWQFLTQTTFSSKWLGMASHSQAGLAGESVIETAAGRWLRAYGGLDHPNILGGFLATALIILIIWKLNNYSKNNFLKLYTSYFILFTLAAGLFFTFSRASWLALVVGLAVILFGAIYKKDLILIRRGGLKIIFALSLLFIFLFFIFGDLAKARVLASGRLEDKSISERALYYNDFKEVIKNEWLTGTGVNNYVLAVEGRNHGRPAFDYQPVHNSILLVWAETGLLGLSGYVGLLLYFAYYLLKKTGTEKTNLNLATAPGGAPSSSSSVCGGRILNLTILLALFILLMLDHWLWSLHFGLIFFWFILGYLKRDEELT